MKQAFNHNDRNHNKATRLASWVKIIIPLLVMIGSVGVMFNSALASKNNNVKSSPSHGYDMLSNNKQSDIKARIAAKNKLEKQKLKLRNLVASQEIKEAENYLMELSNKSEALKNIVSKFDHPSVTYDFSTPLKKGYISSPYGNRKDPINGSLRHHSGLDIAAKTGSKVYAIANGFVTFQGKKGAYGNLLEINHSESLKSRYAHLDSFLVKKGQLVRKGDLIGKVGATGRVTGPHLHLEIRENNNIKNPSDYLKSALKGL